MWTHMIANITVLNLKFPFTHLSLFGSFTVDRNFREVFLYYKLVSLVGHSCKGWALCSTFLPDSLAKCFHQKLRWQKNWLQLFVEGLLIQLCE